MLSRLCRLVALSILSAATACSASENANVMPFTHNSPAVVRGMHGAGYKTLYGFKGGKDGQYPTTALAAQNGILYGTTSGGGAHRGGTVFSLSTSGTKRVLYSFPGAWNPSALVAYKGRLYGTTTYGGTHNDGTVFSVTPSGSLRFLYSFGSVPNDGCYPLAGLVALNGKLYGTTKACGSNFNGTVFSIAPEGTEAVIYNFDKRPDGLYPYGGLVVLHGVLYGTTYQGGKFGGGYGLGTVFSVTAAGSERVLHSFGASQDGYYPETNLTVYNGSLYGTTYSGGKRCGCGTVFSVSPSGNEHLVYSFQGAADGSGLVSGLIVHAKAFLGTTSNGGSGCGCGTIYSISPAGAKKTVYSFGTLPDGNGSMASLLSLNGAIYGTGKYGGKNNSGTVFSLSP